MSDLWNCDRWRCIPSEIRNPFIAKIEDLWDDEDAASDREPVFHGLEIATIEAELNYLAGVYAYYIPSAFWELVGAAPQDASHALAFLVGSISDSSA